MIACPPRVYRTRPVPTALCAGCERVTPFVCCECHHPLCAICMNQYTGLCGACLVLTHGQSQNVLQQRANAYWWAFFDELMLPA